MLRGVYKHWFLAREGAESLRSADTFPNRKLLCYRHHVEYYLPVRVNSDLSMQKPPLSSRTGTPRAKRRGALRTEHRVITDIALQVRRARIALRLTQSDLAGLSSTGPRFIVDLEHGKPTIELGKLIDVLIALGLTLRVESLQRGVSS